MGLHSLGHEKVELSNDLKSAIYNLKREVRYQLKIQNGKLYYLNSGWKLLSDLSCSLWANPKGNYIFFTYDMLEEIS